MKFLITAILTLFSLQLFAQDTTAHKTNPEVFMGESVKLANRQRWNLHFQTTYIYQYKPAFDSTYTSTNSLSWKEEKQNSLTATIYFGVKLWKGAELYINPEVAGGRGLTGAFGLAASTNGETFRVGDPSPTIYLAKGYIKQTIHLDDDTIVVEDNANQLTCMTSHDYLQFMLGKFSLGDIFDNNAYSNSPRTQFMNWCLMNNGAWDYAANLRGYTLGFAAILQKGNMSYRAALATLPVFANGEKLNTDLSQEYSLNAEVINSFKIHDKDGHIRLLGYYNNGDMGNYRQAINNDPGLPDVISTRKYGRTKIGVGLNMDQKIDDIFGVFVRAGWSDGKNETWCFTEADQSVSTGLYIDGEKWKRKDDNISIALVVNGLSQDHRQYLSNGGLGFQLGDGKLNYGHESVLEAYYSFKPPAFGLWLTADYQLVMNPGYNRDRGPVNVFSVRVHVEL